MESKLPEESKNYNWALSWYFFGIWLYLISQPFQFSLVFAQAPVFATNFFEEQKMWGKHKVSIIYFFLNSWMHFSWTEIFTIARWHHFLALWFQFQDKCESKYPEAETNFREKSAKQNLCSVQHF